MYICIYIYIPLFYISIGISEKGTCFSQIVSSKTEVSKSTWYLMDWHFQTKTILSSSTQCAAALIRFPGLSCSTLCEIPYVPLFLVSGEWNINYNYNLLLYHLQRHSILP